MFSAKETRGKPAVWLSGAGRRHASSFWEIPGDVPLVWQVLHMGIPWVTRVIPSAEWLRRWFWRAPPPSQVLTLSEAGRNCERPCNGFCISPGSEHSPGQHISNGCTDCATQSCQSVQYGTWYIHPDAFSCGNHGLACPARATPSACSRAGYTGIGGLESDRSSAFWEPLSAAHVSVMSRTRCSSLSRISWTSTASASHPNSDRRSRMRSNVCRAFRRSVGSVLPPKVGTTARRPSSRSLASPVASADRTNLRGSLSTRAVSL